MSVNQPETTNSSLSSSGSLSQGPTLQRETMVMVNDRGRFGLLVALCSLAGVAVGFGLSNMAAGLHGSHCSLRAPAAAVHIASPAQTQTPTWLGVRIKDHDSGSGAYILSVEQGSPASRAGLEVGDVVVGFTSSGCSKRARDVAGSSDLVRLVQGSDVGDRAVIIVERDGVKRSIRATLEQMPVDIFYDVYGR